MEYELEKRISEKGISSSPMYRNQNRSFALRWKDEYILKPFIVLVSRPS